MFIVYTGMFKRLYVFFFFFSLVRSSSFVRSIINVVFSWFRRFCRCRYISIIHTVWFWSDVLSSIVRIKISFFFYVFVAMVLAMVFVSWCDWYTPDYVSNRCPCGMYLSFGYFVRYIFCIPYLSFGIIRFNIIFLPMITYILCLSFVFSNRPIMYEIAVILCVMFSVRFYRSFWFFRI